MPGQAELDISIFGQVPRVANLQGGGLNVRIIGKMGPVSSTFSLQFCRFVWGGEGPGKMVPSTNILSKSYSFHFENVARNYLEGGGDLENINFVEKKPKFPLWTSISLIFLALDV